MKILIFLFAMITFYLMMSDPRRDYFGQGDSTAQDSDQLQPERKKEDSKESS